MVDRRREHRPGEPLPAIRGSTTKQTIDQTRSSDSASASPRRRAGPGDLPVVPVLELAIAGPRRGRRQATARPSRYPRSPGDGPSTVRAVSTSRLSSGGSPLTLPAMWNEAHQHHFGSPGWSNRRARSSRRSRVRISIRRSSVAADSPASASADAGDAPLRVIRRWRAGRSPAGPSPAANRSGGRPRSRRPRTSRAFPV